MNMPDALTGPNDVDQLVLPFEEVIEHRGPAHLARLALAGQLDPSDLPPVEDLSWQAPEHPGGPTHQEVVDGLLARMADRGGKL